MAEPVKSPGMPDLACCTFNGSPFSSLWQDAQAFKRPCIMSCLGVAFADPLPNPHGCIPDFYNAICEATNGRSRQSAQIVWSRFAIILVPKDQGTMMIGGIPHCGSVTYIVHSEEPPLPSGWGATTNFQVYRRIEWLYMTFFSLSVTDSL